MTIRVAMRARVASWGMVAGLGWCLVAGPGGLGAVEPGQFYTRGSSSAKRLALTFDDGPGPETPKVLALLDRYGVKATFFMLGELAELRGDQVKQVAARGHEVASHTWNHTNYKEHFKKVQAGGLGEAGATARSREDLVKDMRRTQGVLEKACGAKVALCRMPHGIDRPWVREGARAAGVALVNWTYGADWNAGSAKALAPGYLKAIQPGAILLFHDGGRDRAKTLEIVEEVLKQARQQGYECVTVGTLLASGAPSRAASTGAGAAAGGMGSGAAKR